MCTVPALVAVEVATEPTITEQIEEIVSSNLQRIKNDVLAEQVAVDLWPIDETEDLLRCEWHTETSHVNVCSSIDSLQEFQDSLEPSFLPQINEIDENHLFELDSLEVTRNAVECSEVCVEETGDGPGEVCENEMLLELDAVSHQNPRGSVTVKVPLINHWGEQFFADSLEIDNATITLTSSNDPLDPNTHANQINDTKSTDSTDSDDTEFLVKDIPGEGHITGTFGTIFFGQFLFCFALCRFGRFRDAKFIGI